LNSLSLDTCSGVWKLLENLADTSNNRFQTISVDQTTNRRLPVKLCPRLDSISLLACEVEAEWLSSVVKTRNVGRDISLPAADGGIVSVRPMVPMKKLRRPVGNASSVGGPRPSAVVEAMSPGIAMEAALCPARIICIRIEGCHPITEDEALSLRDLGVEDVVWNNAS